MRSVRIPFDNYIKKYILKFIAVVSLLLLPSQLIAQDVIPKGMNVPEVIVQKKDYTKDEIQQLIYKYADKHGVDHHLADYIVSNESHGNVNALGDMDKICKRNGKPVRARGLMQITECYHQNVSDEQAFNPNFNLDYGMKLASDKSSCIAQFSTCRDYYRIYK